VKWLGRSCEDSKDEHKHLLDAVLKSVMIFRLAAGAVAEVVVPLSLAKAGFLSGCPVVLGIVAATEERSEDAKFHACVGANGGHSQSAPVRVEEDAVGVDLDSLPHLAPQVLRADGCNLLQKCADSFVGLIEVAEDEVCYLHDT
jgi:hypothetical protein